jgi:capsular exopolysaccharide synthesis family protein
MSQGLQHLTSFSDLAPLTYQSVGQVGIEPESVGTPLSHYLWVIKRGTWKIAAFMGVSLMLTFLISSRITPIYEATATINIDRQGPTGLVGDDSKGAASTLSDADQYIATQMKIIQSDAVLRPVANKFNLLSREHRFDGLTQQSIRTLKEAPTELKRLHVIRPPNTYLVRVNYRSSDPQLAADVANAVAKSYLAHIYRLQIASSMSAAGFMEKQIDDLKAKMERSGQALAQFEKELNVVNPEEKTNIISQRLLQLNTEYTNAQADRVKKEAVYQSLQNGFIVAEQISGLGDDLQKLQDKINDAEAAFAEIKATRGANHPEYKKLQSQLNALVGQYKIAEARIKSRIEVDFNQAVNREKMLAQAVAQTKAEFDQINERSVDYQRLKDEAVADKKLYEELTTKIQEDGINSGFQNRNTTISDAARPPSTPIFPNNILNLTVAAILSLVLGIAVILLLDSLDTTVRDPEDVSRLFNTDLLGMLPVVRNMKTLSPLESLSVARSVEGQKADLYSNRAFTSYEEAIRMLRNSVLLSNFDSRLRSVLFTSAAPGEGKTTTAIHLAIAHAEQGKRTLLIDADLRRPTIHKKLGINSEIGLSSVLTGEAKCFEAITPIDGVPNLDVLTAGPSSRRAADVIGAGMADLLDELASKYDLTIIDAPPMLGFAEPMQLARTTDGVVVVAVSGETNRKAIAAVVSTLQRLRANVLGLVLNRMTKEGGNGYYYYYSRYDKYYGVSVTSAT